jgi:hypothetical protein
MALPEGLKFLHVGWWLLHALTIALVYAYAYRKGRVDARREMKRPPDPPR